MRHGFGGLVLQVLAQINHSKVLAHVLVGDVSDPPGDSGREEANLKLVSALRLDLPEDLVNIFLESKLEHLVGLIQDDGLDAAEVDVTSLDVIQDTASGSDEEVNSASELSGLVLDRHTTVDSESLVFVLRVLQSREFSRDL